jgi:NTP pyrophosphatase (non-canonical NTP hydrolase)
MDIKALQWELAAFVVDRGLDPLHTPKNLSMALAAEAGALLALFKWLEDGDAPSLAGQAERNAAADALADSVLHAIHLADRLGIDLDEAIRRKLARNAEKYPPVVPETPAQEAAAPAPAAAPERRVASDRRVTPDRRAAPERRFEPERRAGSDRRAGADRRSSASRAAAAAEPETLAPVPPPVRPSPARVEPPPRGRVAEPPPPARVVAPPPAARYEPPPPPPRPEPPAARYEPPPPPPRPEPPAARYEPPPAPLPEPVEEVDPYANLDPDAARRLVDTLSRQVNRARSDDPLARELHDELTTLKRTLYAEDPKRAWLASSLKSIRRILDEATAHSVGAELRASEYLAEVDRILKA